MHDLGALKKLRIEAYSQPDCSGTVGEIFEAYLNPNEITLSYEIEYNSASGSGTTASPMTFKNMKPGDMSLIFFIDGTGANGSLVDVQKRIEQFQKVTCYNGEIHRTNYLKVAWGTLAVKRCVLKSLSIAYKMFHPNGVPLRAVLTAAFTDSYDDKTRVAMAQDKSPDLTHVRLVKAGDNLPTLCYKIYGDPCYYLDVAKANRIDQFRKLSPGTKIFFPPLEK